MKKSILALLLLSTLGTVMAAPAKKYACLGSENINGKSSRVFFTVTYSDFLRGEGYTSKTVDFIRTQSGYSSVDVDTLRNENLNSNCKLRHLDEFSSIDSDGSTRFTYRQSACSGSEVFSFTGKCKLRFN